MDKNISIKSQITTYDVTSCQNKYIEEAAEEFFAPLASLVKTKEMECGKCLYHKATLFNESFGWLCGKCYEWLCSVDYLNTGINQPGQNNLELSD